MASTSCAKESPVTVVAMKEVASSSSTPHPLPTPLARNEDIVADPKLFMSSLEKLHATLGTKFMIPIIGGKELDLHRLFVEVTSRGGIEKILKERRWKEVTAIFNFPSTATNASFVLRKYYMSLLHRYEQVYFFRSQDSLQSPSTPSMPSPSIQAADIQQPRTNAAVASGAKPSLGTQVVGVIDGKFESGYLVTIMIGSERLKGVLYQSPQSPAAHQVPPSYNVSTNNTHTVSGVQRRRRRKKSEIKRRDPAHPKPNRSGYNFFFAEQHARLKPLHPGKDREISRMIGELWNTLKESGKAVYQEKALEDKERYRIELEDYKERQKTGQLVSDAVPLRQQLPEPDVNMVEADIKLDEAGADSPQTPDNESNSDGSDCEDETVDKDLDMEVCPGVGLGAESSNVGVETSTEEPAFELPKGEVNVGDNRDDKVRDYNTVTSDVVEKARDDGGESIADALVEIKQQFQAGAGH
ncbi:hypothetical protein LWI29_037177 [Acer saccharum]|uniref:Uncharacterized protein n=1 Tax=Acer saccharum TaxID=4024 RepID=A0AA39U116_ACESA|nr:hypothetical protein LWI29_037177 [Acer saccharum]KAK1553594.1 hypothetical protein Q3G72_000895 [Acer saccharum]